MGHNVTVDDGIMIDGVDVGTLPGLIASAASTTAVIEQSMPPVGTIIPFYDFNGALTYNTTYWALCDGHTVTIAGVVGPQTLPDLSNRYLVGFGTERGGDMGTATWDTSPVGNASHEINLAHSHTVAAHTHDLSNHTHTIPSHTHTGTTAASGAGATGGPSTNVTSSESEHTHGPGSLKFQVAKTDPGRGTDTNVLSFFDRDEAPISVTKANVDLGGSGFQVTHPYYAPYRPETFYTKLVPSSTRPGDVNGGSTERGSPHSHTMGNHTHSVSSHTHTFTTDASVADVTGRPSSNTSGSASPRTDSQLSATQSIQPRSVRVRFLMRIR